MLEFDLPCRDIQWPWTAEISLLNLRHPLHPPASLWLPSIPDSPLFLCSRPNVCAEQQLAVVGLRQPCVQAARLWQQDCGGRRWCAGHERRVVYYTGYRQVYQLRSQTTYRCCPGWSQLAGDAGCLHSKCHFILLNFLCFGSCRVGVPAFSPSFFADVDECQVHNGGCQHRCVNTLGSFYCECQPGFRLHTDGRTCLALNSCALNNGGCEHDCVQVTLAQHRCQCRHNHQLHQDGKRCILRNPCSDRNGGCMQRCLNHRGRARCECHPGYLLAPDGKNCEDVNECLTGLAMCAHQCLNTRGSFKCTCNPGYELGADGRRCYRIEMEIVNSCETNNGGCSHVCHHTSSGPVCTCNFGFRLEEDQKSCTDINECDTGSHCCQQDCYNYPGGYECSCHAGYRLSTDGCGCDDVDECSANNGGCEHTCQNLPGSFQCVCDIGHKLDEDRRSCISLEDTVEALDGRRPVIRPIPHVAILRDELTQLFSHDYEEEEEEELEARGEHTLSEKFVCLEHTFGPDCSLTCDDCQNGATCSAEGSGCICMAGWTGVLCNQTCPAGTFGINCSQSCRCQNGGTCDPANGSCRCPPGVAGELCQDGCPKGFYGKHCRKKCNCANRGHCHRIYGACLCDPGLYGRFCHLGMLRLSLNPSCDPGYYGDGCKKKCSCSPGVPCDPVTGECHKECPPGYHGEHCDQECPEGTFGPGCQHSCACGEASCDRSTGQCHCPPGWTGHDCAQACPEGLWGPGCQEICPDCANNASCDHATGACVCPPGYTGQRCQDGEVSEQPLGGGSLQLPQHGVASNICCPQQHCHTAAATKATKEGAGSFSLWEGSSSAFCVWISPLFSTACPDGFYGLECRQACDCLNGAHCDPVTGQCQCPPGWTGARCAQGRCLCPGQVSVGGALPALHGTLEPGLAHRPCLLCSPAACPENSYGQNCSHTCRCFNNATCSHISGRCLCPEGWTGPSCQQGNNSQTPGCPASKVTLPQHLLILPHHLLSPQGNPFTAPLFQQGNPSTPPTSIVIGRDVWRGVPASL
uniref:Multiple EGF-like-domains 6 n=1 Tax=Zonotrichia albicollis TaxID=44394 RepID=A0A8D2M6L8_ZONAL